MVTLQRVGISVEHITGDDRGDIQIYGSSTVRWATPHDDELIPDGKRHLLLKRLVDDIAQKDKWKAWVVFSPEKEDYERGEAARLKAAKNIK